MTCVLVANQVTSDWDESDFGKWCLQRLDGWYDWEMDINRDFNTPK